MIRLALPTGDLRTQTAALLERAGCGIPEYAAGSRSLRFEALGGAAIARVFRERDIPVQIALGQYDAGVCALEWVLELTSRYPRLDLLPLRDLQFGARTLWLASAGDTAEPSVRIASEYANIADALARRMRLARYRVFALRGAAAAYPPEDADLALIAASDAAAVEAHGLRPLAPVFDSSVWLIVNRRSLATKDLSPLLSRLLGAGTQASLPSLRVPDAPRLRTVTPAPRERLRVALPDGHAQAHTVEALRQAGITVENYTDGKLERRPRMDGADVKVIRPQDMPQQVALGQFDLAVTGRDVLFDYLVQFPSSPVREIIDLGRSRYGLAAIVKDVQADTVAGAVREWRAARGGRPIRVASEFANIADHFARERHFGRYSVIPIDGASEGFVPEDAELLIEGIETGSSVKANNLTVLERFFESTNIVIASTKRPDGERGRAFDALVERLRAGALQPATAGGA